MVHIRDVYFKLFSEQPADERHECLKTAEKQRNDGSLFFEMCIRDRYTQIKIDEITNLGAVKIRLRSLVGAIAERSGHDE